jgi:hypothetical protein
MCRLCPETVGTGRQGELEEGREEACFLEGGADENTVKIPLFADELLLSLYSKLSGYGLEQ